MLKRLLSIRSGRKRYQLNNLAQQIMGQNFIGTEELRSLEKFMSLEVPRKIPVIPFSHETLELKKDDYLLILGVSKFSNGEPVTIRNLQKIFGKNPDIKEPCFYNQDWYDREEFIDIPMSEGWYFIRKAVYENSRAVQPTELIREYSFPSAIKCCYSFFVAWLCLEQKLWYHDFVWCNDTDHNGDQIYVGKYHDVDGVNKNGFSIHRHLALRPCYGCID